MYHDELQKLSMKDNRDEIAARFPTFTSVQSALHHQRHKRLPSMPQGLLLLTKIFKCFLKLTQFLWMAHFTHAHNCFIKSLPYMFSGKARILKNNLPYACHPSVSCITGMGSSFLQYTVFFLTNLETLVLRHGAKYFGNCT